MRSAEGAGVEVVGVNVFAKVDHTRNLIRLLPSDVLIFLISSKDDRSSGELEIMEIEVVKLFLPCSINFERSDYIHC